MELIVEIREVRTARTRSGGVSSLDDETVDGSVKRTTVVESALRQGDDAFSNTRDETFEELEDHPAEARHVDSQTSVTFGDDSRR